MTQNKQRENWVVICGLVRDRQLFNTKLEKYSTLTLTLA